MADLQTVIALLYRADWTRLSLSAGVRFERDGDLAQRRLRAMWPPGFRPGPPITEDEPEQERDGYYTGHAALLIAPGRRYRLEHLDDAAGAVGGAVAGGDGEHGWTWCPGQVPPPWQLQIHAGDDDPPLYDLLCPCGLLSGFALEVRGPVTASGRDAIALAATPRHDDFGSRPSLRDHLYDHVEVIVDAELGIVLRREEMFQAQRLTLTELTAVTLSPPEADDSARFVPPPGSHVSHVSQGFGETLREAFGAPGWQPARTAVGLAAGGLGALIRFGAHLPGRDPAGQDGQDGPEASMPSPDPAPLDPGDHSPVPDDVLYLLYRSGEAHVLNAMVHQWRDVAAMVARVPGPARAAGHRLDAVNRVEPVTRTVARLRVGGPDRYRVDFRTRRGPGNPTTIACDGERRWQVYPNQIMGGPAAPLRRDPGSLVDASWLLGCWLSGGSEIAYRGRRAYQLLVTRIGGFSVAGPLLFFPADAIVDAETGCLLRLISYAGDRPASWWELRDIGTEPGDPAEFRVHVPPGVRTVEETGNGFTDATAVMPGMTGTAVRGAVEAVRLTAGAVSATSRFLDDLRGRNRPPR